MIAMRVVGLMIAFACFNACIGQLLNALTDTVVSSLIGKRSRKFISALDINRDSIVEAKEFSEVADCMSKKLNLDEEGRKRLFENDVPMAWNSFGFGQAEGGNAFHQNTLLNIFAAAKYIPGFKYGVQNAFGLLFDFLRCYSSNNTITLEAFCALHYCIRADPDKTRPAFDNVDVDKDGGISKDELCGAGVDYFFGENAQGTGSLLMG